MFRLLSLERLLRQKTRRTENERFNSNSSSNNNNFVRRNISVDIARQHSPKQCSVLRGPPLPVMLEYLLRVQRTQLRGKEIGNETEMSKEAGIRYIRTLERGKGIANETLCEKTRDDN